MAILVFAVGHILLVATSRWSSPTNEPFPDRAHSNVSQAEPCDRDALKRQVELLDEARADIEAQRDEREARRASWPAEVGQRYREPELSRRLTNVLEWRPDVALADLDCSEYPCIAVFRSEGLPIQEREDLQLHLGDQLSPTQLQQFMLPGEGTALGTHVTVATLADPDIDLPGREARTELRALDLFEAVRREHFESTVPRAAPFEEQDALELGHLYFELEDVDARRERLINDIEFLRTLQ